MFHLIEPELGRISGGLRYNWAVVAAAEGQLVRHSLAGGWPEPSDQNIVDLVYLIDSVDGPVVLDGLIGCSLPTPVRAKVPILQLVHALAQTPEATRRERTCLQAADAVVVTSHFAANQLLNRYGVRAIVAPPGVEKRPLAAGGNGGNLISVGALEPNKNQVFIAEVLELLATRGVSNWHCTFAGPLHDAEYAHQLGTTLARLPEDTTTVTGGLGETQLAALYHQADLLVFPSRAETFGLVVREATAAGIPAFVTAGTGSQEALGAGQALPLDAELWADALEQWLTDVQYRRRLQTLARTARQHLSYGWLATANTILEVLRAVSAD
ncbi:MAG TPA: glycosyltransferase family 4 protein [Enteractinococcus helveticum]|uniref:Glycosyltransferase family 4 protein n=1 Tax=Enteractinococcus helveticum TaxID=1837282 RepID=A0A921K8I7_9MICC|nr:glycosyltransferase family 4 protein [Enteractinococcus helveticum]HJF13989.1 glycosyltransferase family 4 protein [Enteractinococcus helveticum]